MLLKRRGTICVVIDLLLNLLKNSEQSLSTRNSTKTLNLLKNIIERQVRESRIFYLLHRFQPEHQKGS